MKKEIKLVSIIIAIVLIMLLIFYFKQDNNNITEKELRCITENSTIYVSATCGHCANQKIILKEKLEEFNLNLDEFKIIDCSKQTELCVQEEVVAVPMWKINNQKYFGVYSLDKLKQLTNC